MTALAHTGDGVAAIAARRAALARARGTDRGLCVLVSYDAPVSWTIRPDQRVDAGDRRADGVASWRAPTDVARRGPACCRPWCSSWRATTTSGCARPVPRPCALTTGLGDPRAAVRRAQRPGLIATLGPDLWHELGGGRRRAARDRAAGRAGRLHARRATTCCSMVEAARHDLDGAQRHVDAAIAAASAGQLGLTLGWAEIYSAMRALIAGDTGPRRGDLRRRRRTPGRDGLGERRRARARRAVRGSARPGSPRRGRRRAGGDGRPSRRDVRRLPGLRVPRGRANGAGARGVAAGRVPVPQLLLAAVDVRAGRGRRRARRRRRRPPLLRASSCRGRARSPASPAARSRSARSASCWPTSPR